MLAHHFSLMHLRFLKNQRASRSLLRQVYVGVFFGVFLAPFFWLLLARLLGPFFAPLGANMVGFGGQLGSQNGAEIKVFARPRGYLS